MMRRAIRSWRIFLIATFLLPCVQAPACLWDSTTLKTERKRHPQLAEVILGEPTKAEEAGPLRERIAKLLANKHEDDPTWLNDLAGAHIRLGELKEAVALLEPGVKKFPQDYGVHANLGTAFHLQGRYAEAEQEIARDLEINPEAHFGLEKYHLALLQYLIRDEGYRSRHVYVDEFTISFLSSSAYHLGPDSVPGHKGEQPGEPKNDAEQAELAKFEKNYQELVKGGGNAQDFSEILIPALFYDRPVTYKKKWDLKRDAKLQEGVVYMATLNPKEPACFQMLGILCLQNRDRNLAAAAYEKAIALSSPQTPLLRLHATRLRNFIKESQANEFHPWLLFSLIALIPLLIMYYFSSKRRKLQRNRVEEGTA